MLNANQIRYCLTEDARLESVRHRAGAAVERFNGLINDWNRRCASYRYMPSVMEMVQREVEASRSSITTDGLARYSWLEE